MTASEEHHIETPQPEPSDRRLLASMVGWVGVILIFVLILYIAYVPNRTGPVDEQVTERRTTILEDVRMREVSLLQSYSRSATGSVRIPVERAMEVIPQTLNQIPVQAASAAPQGGQQAAQPSEQQAPQQEQAQTEPTSQPAEQGQNDPAAQSQEQAQQPSQ